MSGQEIEIKFLTRDLRRIETRLQELGARLIQPRAHEINLRFDNAQNALREQSQVLRLRKDSEVKLTFKGAGQILAGGIIARQEIEFAVGDFDAAKDFLQALGFAPILFYEKYRTIYQLRDALIMLDKLPYGSFIEIESERISLIHETANLLNLNLGAAIKESYAALFARIAQHFNLDPSQLSFQAFARLVFSPADFQINYAD